MKPTHQEQLVLEVMLALARARSGSASVRDLGAALQMAPSTLKTLFERLMDAGLLRCKSAPDDCYGLARAPRWITAADIVLASQQGPGGPARGQLIGARNRASLEATALRALETALNRCSMEFLQAITLQDLALGMPGCGNARSHAFQREAPRHRPCAASQPGART
ncbi:MULTISPECIES: Rrf2 family transcriptional regulator [Thiomonas]|uniref:Putative transcriptional regulator n=1 Tax=Thiomonas delicata TaxID=364030 RepID=A0A238D7F1_THIDL|nr:MULTISPECIES: Rrf2 family transcriptional regulator [Thiomonas]CQR42432.1 putative transcriptional regulator [Thiomonas sp. CB3]CDW96267.1 putative transcriptional regulator [Thiomonas sp. CB2]SBP89090.1 putative transcriptional regulator [Thiomonas delicata]VDY06796.1 putative transcriptional regulator [Thiomonas sp. Bio17B3]VDY09907.1 putative transcriptional regulator [Thiomonas sp. Sup16B3]